MQHKWMNDQYRSSAMALIRLISGALNSRDPGEMPTSETELEQILQIAESNDVEGIAFCALKYISNPVRGTFYERMKSSWAKTCYRQLCFDREREEILQDMEKCGLSYLPLKGITLSEYYPEPGMRFMADNDILYGFTEISESGNVRLRGVGEEERNKYAEQASEKLYDIMTSRGYSLFEADEGVHDTFHKRPFFNFEMHRELVSKTNSRKYYYADPWSRALSEGECGLRFRFRCEDEYIYNIIHALKHMDSNGYGIRFFADIYVFLKSKGENMDRDYIDKELELLGLVSFEKKIRDIAVTAFDMPELLTAEQREELFFHMGCGAFGNAETRANILLDKLESENNSGSVKFHYIKSRLFIPGNVAESAFPKLYKSRLLRPLIPVYRVMSAVIMRPKVVIAEIRALLSYHKDR